jgi:hypothetical protein
LQLSRKIDKVILRTYESQEFAVCVVYGLPIRAIHYLAEKDLTIQP